MNDDGHDTVRVRFRIGLYETDGGDGLNTLAIVRKTATLAIVREMAWIPRQDSLIVVRDKMTPVSTIGYDPATDEYVYWLGRRQADDLDDLRDQLVADGWTVEETGQGGLT